MPLAETRRDMGGCLERQQGASSTLPELGVLLPPGMSHRTRWLIVQSRKLDRGRKGLALGPPGWAWGQDLSSESRLLHPSPSWIQSGPPPRSPGPLRNPNPLCLPCAPVVSSLARPVSAALTRRTVQGPGARAKWSRADSQAETQAWADRQTHGTATPSTDRHIRR